MAQAKVTIRWTKSVTPSVTAQKLQLIISGTPAALQTLAPDVQSVDVVVDELTEIDVELWATDGVLDSSHLTGMFKVPEITAPAPPTDLTFSFVPLTSPPG